MGRNNSFRRLVDARHGFVVGVEELERREAPTILLLDDIFGAEQILVANDVNLGGGHSLGDYYDAYFAALWSVRLAFEPDSSEASSTPNQEQYASSTQWIWEAFTSELHFLKKSMTQTPGGKK